MRKLLIVLALGLALLTGCASNPDYDAWARAVEAQHNYAATAASGCQTDLCRYVVTQEVAANTIRAPRQEIHPGWQSFFGVLNTAVTLGLPGHFGVKNAEVWAGMTTGVTNTIGGMDRAYTNNSVNIGRDQIGGDRTVDSSNHSINAGGNLAGGDQIGGDSVGGDQWHGDRYSDSCIGDDCRSASPGPWDIDESDNSTTDNSDNSDNSTQPEPVDLSSE